MTRTEPTLDNSRCFQPFDKTTTMTTEKETNVLFGFSLSLSLSLLYSVHVIKPTRMTLARFWPLWHRGSTCGGLYEWGSLFYRQHRDIDSPVQSLFLAYWFSRLLSLLHVDHVCCVIQITSHQQMKKKKRIEIKQTGKRVFFPFNFFSLFF